jgi:hypothetical protein
MAEKGRDPHIAALEAVYAALKDLDPLGRRKVLSSVFALLDLEGTPTFDRPTRRISLDEDLQPAASSSRPISLVELINEKKPGTNAQHIALFAYYREKSEGISRFERDDLKPYFAKAKKPPPTNYDRDFVEAVRKGWIHEDRADSYLTSRGVEAVESGFEGERKYTKVRKASATVRGKKKRSQSNERRKRKP